MDSIRRSVVIFDPLLSLTDWLPRGHHACPGSAFARRVMLLSNSMLLGMFEIEILVPESQIQYGSERFGLGSVDRTPRFPFGYAVEEPLRVPKRCRNSSV